MEGKFKHWCWQRRLRKVLRRNTVHRDPVGFGKAYTIGIYDTYRSEEEWNELRVFARQLAERNKKVKVFVFFQGKTMPELKADNFTLVVADRKEFDRLWFPQREINAAVEDFLDTEYDLLLDFSPEFHYVDVSVMATCVSRMNVGKYGEWNVKVNDVSLEPDGRAPTYARGFIKVLERYLPLFDKEESSPGR
ncbi:MAG: hypothetical protein K2L50_04355 [Bacteroidales bacterium]|nr:hypothetical protein [Bacteroidales bacterium]